jgi:two-component system CheB/CheR fusion protein
MQKVAFSQILSPAADIDSFCTKKDRRTDSPPKLSLLEITEQSILRECSVAGILTNASGNILYLHGRTGMYLEPSQGESGINNVLKMARQGLKKDLTMALSKAAKQKEAVRMSDINVKTNGHFTMVNMIVKQVSSSLVSPNRESLFIVLLEEACKQSYTKSLDSLETEPAVDKTIQLEDLKTELRLKEEYLKTANEDLEVSNEELKSANEEMQSINEELQSTNEELETSKEELQSINEELSTVNSELQAKVHDVTQINNDMNNLIAGSNIATIFLDYQQNILRFTPTANKIINLIISDVGRPVAHIVSNLREYNQLTNDVKTVLDSLIPKEIQVQAIDGRWYNMIIQPYRTIENVIEGTVLTFVDITEAKTAKDLLAVSEMSYRTLFETSGEGILILDGLSGKIRNVNPFLIKLLGYSKEQLLEKEIWEIGLFKDILANKDNFLELQKEKYIRYKDLPLETADGRKIDVEFISNLYEIENNKIIQCNIRNGNYQR